MDTKICNVCKIEKPLSEFNKGYKRKDGSHSVGYCCRDCQSVYKKKHHIEHAEYIRKKAKDWYEENKIHAKKRISEYNRTVYNDKRKSVRKKWKRNNPEAVRESAIEVMKGVHRRNCDNLTDTYIVNQITKHYALNAKEVRALPSLIAAKRIMIKLERLIYNKNQKK